MNVTHLLTGILFVIIAGTGVSIVEKVLEVTNAKIDKVQKETKLKENELLNSYIDFAQEVITKAVITVSQTYVDSLKKSGKFDKEAQVKAKKYATEIAKNLISTEGEKAIKTIYKDYDNYVDSVIESTCKKLKDKTVQ